MKKCNISRREFIRKSPALAGAGLYTTPEFSAVKDKEDLNQSSLSEQKYQLGSLNPFEFHNPGTEYRGIPLWFFNDRLDREDLIAQLKAMRYAGWGRVMPRRYTGGTNPAYGKKWNDAIRTVIEVCKELDMKVYLPEIDKNGWYTAAPTPLPGMRDEYRNKSLIQRRNNEKPGKNEKLITQIGDYSYYQYTSFPKEGWENSFCYLDLLDPDVVNSYSKVLFEFFYREFGSEFGKTVEGIWIAEPHIMMGQPSSADCLPWTPKLPQVFEKDWGYPLLDKLPLLFNDEGEYQKIRYHYWRTLSNLFTLSYMKTTGEWCKKYNLVLTGHLMGEDTFISQLQYSVNVMPHYEYMDMPGIDHLTMNLNWPTGDPFIMTPKQVSSVANQLGKKEVISEMYGCCDEGLTFEDRKRMYQWFSLMGINYRCYHGSFMSMRGARKRIYPPSFNYQQPYWSGNRIIGDFGGRLSYALRQGDYKADILIIHSIESYFLKGKIARKLSKVIGENDRHLINLSHNLFKIHRSFDYGDETILSRHARVVNNQMQVGRMSYKVIILPSIDTIRKSTFKLLKDFLSSGGTIISTGNFPTMIDGEITKEIEAVNSKAVRVANGPDALKEYFEKHLPNNIHITASNVKSGESLWVHQRKVKDGQIWFISNINSEETIEAEIKIKGTGKLESWNIETGKIENIIQAKEGEFIRTKLTFAPNASYILVLNEKAAPINRNKPNETREIWQKPVEDFIVKRKDPNSLTLDFCRYKKGNGEWSDILPVQGIQEKLNDDKYYGPLSLQFEFEADDKPSHCELVIEEADKYKISVNGREARYEGIPYYRDRSFLPVRITDFVRKGKNFIEISRDFQSAEDKVLGIEELDRFYGTELEQIYLIGDFAVKGNHIGQDQFETERRIFSPSFSISRESFKTKGDLLNDGYCFFNGTINLTSAFNIPEIKDDEKYYLEIEKLETVHSKIRINNLDAGHISWKPYRIDITGLVWKGENKIEIALTNSLRNLLGEIHFIPLEEDKNSSQWSLKVTPRLADGPDWYEKRKTRKLKTWSDNYHFRPFGIFGKVSIKAEK